jgi:hypothetical protein
MSYSQIRVLLCFLCLRNRMFACSLHCLQLPVAARPPITSSNPNPCPAPGPPPPQQPHHALLPLRPPLPPLPLPLPIPLPLDRVRWTRGTRRPRLLAQPAPPPE